MTTSWNNQLLDHFTGRTFITSRKNKNNLFCTCVSQHDTDNDTEKSTFASNLWKNGNNTSPVLSQFWPKKDNFKFQPRFLANAGDTLSTVAEDQPNEAGVQEVNHSNMDNPQETPIASTSRKQDDQVTKQVTNKVKNSVRFADNANPNTPSKVMSRQFVTVSLTSTTTEESTEGIAEEESSSTEANGIKSETSDDGNLRLIPLTDELIKETQRNCSIEKIVHHIMGNSKKEKMSEFIELVRDEIDKRKTDLSIYIDGSNVNQLKINPTVMTVACQAELSAEEDLTATRPKDDGDNGKETDEFNELQQIVKNQNDVVSENFKNELFGRNDSNTFNFIDPNLSTMVINEEQIILFPNYQMNVSLPAPQMLTSIDIPPELESNILFNALFNTESEKASINQPELFEVFKDNIYGYMEAKKLENTSSSILLKRQTSDAAVMLDNYKTDNIMKAIENHPTALEDRDILEPSIRPSPMRLLQTSFDVIYKLIEEFEKREQNLNLKMKENSNISNNLEILQNRVDKLESNFRNFEKFLARIRKHKMLKLKRKAREQNHKGKEIQNLRKSLMKVAANERILKPKLKSKKLTMGETKNLHETDGQHIKMENSKQCTGINYKPFEPPTLELNPIYPTLSPYDVAFYEYRQRKMNLLRYKKSDRTINLNQRPVMQMSGPTNLSMNPDVKVDIQQILKTRSIFLTPSSISKQHPNEAPVYQIPIIESQRKDLFH